MLLVRRGRRKGGVSSKGRRRGVRGGKGGLRKLNRYGYPALVHLMVGVMVRAERLSCFCNYKAMRGAMGTIKTLLVWS
jgi:hypothetical protein